MKPENVEFKHNYDSGEETQTSYRPAVTFNVSLNHHRDYSFFFRGKIKRKGVGVTSLDTMRHGAKNKSNAHKAIKGMHKYFLHILWIVSMFTWYHMVLTELQKNKRHYSFTQRHYFYPFKDSMQNIMLFVEPSGGFVYIHFITLKTFFKFPINWADLIQLTVRHNLIWYMIYDVYMLR